MTGGLTGGRAYRYYDLVMAAFVAVLLISNIASSKILVLGPFTFDGGTILFPISYIFNDVLTEVYGYARARRVIWVSFAAAALMAAILAIVGALPADPSWGRQEAYEMILGVTPRIVAGSLLAFWVGSFSNAWVLARLKILTAGRWLWTRTVASTLVGEGLDTVVFVLLAFYGVLPHALLLPLIASNYVFKVGMEAVMTPVTYWVVNGLKRAEHEDHYDRGTDFSPFRLDTGDRRRTDDGG